MSDDLTERLLSKPVGPTVSAKREQANFTSSIEIRGNAVEAEIRGPLGTVNEGTGLAYLEEEGLNPEEWIATHFRKIKYGQGMESVKFSYVRKGFEGTRPPIDELIAEVKRHRPKATRPEGNHGVVIGLGDMQFGKIDGDGVEGTLARTIAYLNGAADRIALYRKRFDIGHVHLSFLGDHIEGFQSQGGANVWRTPLTLNEQIRLTRRVMTHALTTFAPMAERVSMAAVPGNHGETARFAGKGVTRYDDSHDTESLIAVSEAASFNEKAFGHVEFFVPDTDQMVVVNDVAGTVWAQAHGHAWRVGKALEWWKGQAFHNAELATADVLMAGHLHHFFVETDGPRTFLQVPSLESESTWYRHAKGVIGNPGLVLAITKDHKTNIMEVVQ
ncbi:MAG TPA: hypothetical protein VHO01_16480 [Jatrophihabitans sp.]|nr:hypothetical protein [Jatrophihabitans sp.]